MRDSNEPSLERINTYSEAEVLTKAKLLQEFYRIEEENKNKTNK